MSLLKDLLEKPQWLPGVGSNTAQRLAFYLQKLDKAKVKELTDAIMRARTQLKECSLCHNLAEQDPCAICRDASRDSEHICVVEQPSDVMVIEKTSEYKGLYHVLHGVISPIDNVSPDDLRIQSLLKRLQSKKITEVIIATNPTTEGDVTAMYIAKLVREVKSPHQRSGRQKSKVNNLKITRIGRGLPVGGDLEYADDITLTRAIEGRREF